MINRVVLVGRLSKDVEIRKTATGMSVAHFNVACDRRKSKDQQQSQADFINCVAFGQPADFLGQYARKGAMVGVDGRLQVSSYDKDGLKQWRTDVIAESVRLLESKSANQAQGYAPQPQQQYNAAPQGQPMQNTAPQQPQAQGYAPQPQAPQQYNSAAPQPYPSYNNDGAPDGAPSVAPADDPFGAYAGLDISSDDLPF